MPGPLRANRKITRCRSVEFASLELFLTSFTAESNYCTMVFLSFDVIQGCILFTIQFDEKNTKIYSPSSLLEEKKANSVTVFSIEREERRAQMLSEETGLFS
ncbi:hypothetical protein CDAR_412801 [Caerostris darwini]|uniref:Uncharacterized protein n=1 Tax=Caerostris darwini TaxID=1538125 RepID=A0AAV4SGB0_9ARAC|nr:hypothetical protein CDAR_412801 [Caerostris darwini]